MKLIIDIPEDDYNNIEPFLNGETIKGGFNLFKVLEMIKNGIPLDKIRAEIEEQKNHRFFDDDDMCIYKAGLIDALEIIDKYRERSDKE